MRERYLDSLRGIACLIVLLAHIIGMDTTLGIYASGCGKIGVWFFMVLSGLLLVQRYLCSDDQFYMRQLPEFYSKKLLRILPAYLFAIVFATILGMIGLSEWFSHLLLKNAWGHFWYMPVIIKFYFFAPLVLILLSVLKRRFGKKGVVLFSILIAGFGVLFCIVFPWNTYVENSSSLTWYIPVFCMGILLAVLMRKITFNHKIADGVSLIPIAGIMIATPAFRELIWGAEPSGYLQNKYLYMGCMWCLFIFFVLKGVFWKRLLDKSKVLQKIGDYSYDIYLIHFIVLHKLVAMGVSNTWVRGLITILVSFAVAVVLEMFRKKWRGFVSSKVSLGIVAVLWIIGVVGGNVYVKNTEDTYNYSEKEQEEWKQYLYVPTMINKVGDTYFIVDCWNHRVLYADKIHEDVTRWNDLTDEKYIGGHTVCSDGELLVLDNTDAGNVLVYKKSDSEYKNIQKIENVNGRPHYTLYDEERQLFYIIASTDAKIYVYQNVDGYLLLARIEELEELQGSYVRSINIIEDKLYTVSGPGCIFEYNITESKFTLANSYPVPDELIGMNQITKIEDYYYITVNTGATGSVAETTIVRTKDLSRLKNYAYDDIYDDMGFVGQPYYITHFDGEYYITEISADKGNGIKRFGIKDNEIKHLETLFYWEAVADVSRERYASKSANTDVREKVDLFLFAGQSNMAGKGDGKEAPAVMKGYEFRAISAPSQLYPIEEPFGLYENKADGINDTWEDMMVLRKEGKGGMVSAFADIYYRMTGKPIVGVSCSEGATTIEQWIPGTNRYQDLVERAQSAKNYLNASSEYLLENVYIVWCQGESDGDAKTTAEDYYNRLTLLCNTLVEQGVVNHCFIVAIGENGTDAHLYDKIREMQLKLCEDNEHCTLVSDSFYGMKEAGLMIDEYHYSQEGYNIVGDEAGKTIAKYVFTEGLCNRLSR